MRVLVWIGAIVAPLCAILLSSDANVALRLVALLVAAFPLGLWISLRSPLVLYRVFGFVLGAIPFGTIPGFPLPLALLLGVSLGVTALLQLPRTRGVPFTLVEWGAVVVIVLSAISMLVNLTTSYDVTEFLKWLIATSLILSLCRLAPEQMRGTARAYAWGVGFASLFAIAQLLFDKSGFLLRLLAPLGYGKVADIGQFVVVGDQGDTVRLTGTYIEPNAGGLFLIVGLLLALAYLRGIVRIIMVIPIGAATALTLSRSAIFTAAVAILILFAFQNLRFAHRVRIFTVLAIAAGAALLIPAVQDRLLNSFGQNDAGSTARLDALANYTKLVDGHWLFGLGWGRIEFRDAKIGVQVNFVANTPLLTVYRGGIFVGIALCVILLFGLILAWRNLRSGDFGRGVIGAGFAGFTLVALQVDFPVVTAPSVTALFSLLLAVLVRTATESPPDADAAYIAPPGAALHRPLVAGSALKESI